MQSTSNAIRRTGLTVPTRRPGNSRGRWTLAAAATLVAAVIVALVSGWTAGLGIVFAAGLIALAITLPGKTPEGVVVGFATSFVTGLDWTNIYHPTIARAAQALVAIALLAWAFPWFRSLRLTPRLGTTWIAIAFWISGTLGAITALALGVAVQRLLYVGVYTATALVLIGTYRRRGKDASVGLVAGFLLMLGLLVISGAGNVFESLHYTPPNELGYRFSGRFWGSGTFLSHPNAIGALAVVIVMRVVADGAFRWWQRVAAAAVGVAFINLTDSRTALLVLIAWINIWWWVSLLRHWGTVRERFGKLFIRLGFVALSCLALLVITGGIGKQTLLVSRYAPPTSVSHSPVEPDPLADSYLGGQQDISSGRLSTWKTVGSEFLHDPIGQMAFGHANSAKGAIAHTNSSGVETKLSPDNAVITALRVGGVVGVLAFTFGVLLLLWHSLRRDVPIWLTTYVFAACTSMATANWLLGDTMWQVAIAAEAAVLAGAFARKRSDPLPLDEGGSDATERPADVPRSESVVR